MKTMLMSLLLLTSCGYKLIPGPQGPAGVDGLNGSNGSNGAAGSPGTVITPIQLCAPSFVPTYPNVFPEYILCINGKVYGVYSSLGGYWTELSPGTYFSNGIGSTCTVIIGPNCKVSNP